MSIGLHVIVLVYGLVLGLATIGWDPAEIVRHAKADPDYKQVVLLTALIVGGNLVGAVLLLTGLFKSFVGVCWLIAYELVLLAASISLLALEYAIIVGVIVLALLFVLAARKRPSGARAGA
jgi:hypothetical protein